MTFEQKITTFAVNEAAWLAWLLLGLSMGVTIAVARALSLLAESRAVRGIAARCSSFVQFALVTVASAPDRK
jgi:hypothetical protein